MLQSNWEIALLALCTWREFSGEPVEAQQGGACSIRNRVNKPGWWGVDYQTVICKKYQYSSMTATQDANLVRWPIATDTSWQSCMEIAQAVHDGTLADVTGGATSYYADSIAPPSWVSSMTFTVKLGRTLFYKL